MHPILDQHLEVDMIYVCVFLLPYFKDISNNGSACYSNLGHSFKCPPGIIYGTNAAKNFLAGSYYFKVLEIEVTQFLHLIF